MLHTSLEHSSYEKYTEVMDYRQIVTIESDKRGGRPCIRGMRISVYDILGWLASGMSINEIVDEYPELTEEDVRVALAFAADRGPGPRRIASVA